MLISRYLLATIQCNLRFFRNHNVKYFSKKSKSENNFIFCSDLNEVRKYFIFMIWQKSKSYFLLFFCSDFGEVIFCKNNMFSKYYFIWNQKYFRKYGFKKTKSEFFSKIFSDFDEIILWNHIIFSKYDFVWSQTYFTEVIIFCAPLLNSDKSITRTFYTGFTKTLSLSYWLVKIFFLESCLRRVFTVKILIHQNSYRWLERTQSSPKLALSHWLRVMTQNLQCEKVSKNIKWMI